MTGSKSVMIQEQWIGRRMSSTNGFLSDPSL